MPSDLDETSKRYQQAENKFEYALAAYEAGQLTTARHGLDQALAEFDVMGDLGYVGLCCNWLGQICDLLDQWQEALDYYDRSLDAFRAIGDRQGEGAALGSQALIFMHMAQFQRAIDSAQQALNIQQDIGDRQGEEASLGNLGLIYAETGDYDTALGYYRQSLAIAQEIQDKADEAATLHEMAELFYHTGDWQQSEQTFAKALKQREEIGDEIGRVHTLQSLGLLCQSMGQYSRSLELFQQALAVDENLDIPGQRAATLNNLALTYTLLNRDEEAIELLEEALVHFKAVRDRSTVGTIQMNLGAIHNSLGHSEKAERYLKNALDTHLTTDATYYLALCLAHLATYYSGHGQPEKGLPLVEESLKLFRSMSNREGVGLALNIAGVIHEAVGDYYHALADYQAALVVQEEIDDREGMRATYYNLGRFYEDICDRSDLARRCYRCAITLLEESRAGLERSIHRFTYLLDKLSVYRFLVMLEWQAGNSSAAWETVERMRSRHLIDMLATLSLSPSARLPAHMQQQEKRLLAHLNQLLNTRFVGEESESLSLVNKIGHLERELSELWQKMEMTAPDYVSLRRGQPLKWSAMYGLLGCK